MKLTDAKIRNALPRSRPYKLSDGSGLVMIVTPAGGKWWRFCYRFPKGGPQKMLSLGTYPEVPLAGREDRGDNGKWIDGARDGRDRMRRLLRDGIDPSERRKSEARARAAERESTFEGLWQEWLAHKKEGGHWGEASQSKATFYFHRDVLPKFGSRPLKTIVRIELAEFMRRVEERAPDAAEKIRGWLRGMFDYGVALGRLSENPADKLNAVAKKKARETHHPHLPLSQLPKLLNALDGYGDERGQMTRIAARLLILTGVRPGELRGARWEEFDWDQKLWTIPALRMKMRREHTVPLPHQAIALLSELKQISGKRDLLFPSRDDVRKPMSANTLNGMFRRLGYGGQQTGHGFRHLISTELNERGYDRDEVERQLAHGDEDVIRGTYNHSQLIERRRKMMQEWADCIDGLLATTTLLKPASLSTATVSSADRS